MVRAHIMAVASGEESPPSPDCCVHNTPFLLLLYLQISVIYLNGLLLFLLFAVTRDVMEFWVAVGWYVVTKVRGEGAQGSPPAPETAGEL